MVQCHQVVDTQDPGLSMAAFSETHARRHRQPCMTSYGCVGQQNVQEGSGEELGEQKEVRVRGMKALTYPSSTLPVYKYITSRKSGRLGSLTKTRKGLNEMLNKDLVTTQQKVYTIRQCKVWVWRTSPIIYGLWDTIQVTLTSLSFAFLICKTQ